MAKGEDFGYEDPALDHDMDQDDEEEVNTTRPFQPGAASTPYHGGEQVEMQTMQHEQPGLPDTSYEDTPLLSDFISEEDRQTRIDRAKEFIRSRFPKVDFGKLPPISFSKKGAQTDIVTLGKKGGESKIFKTDGSRLLKSFTDKFSRALGVTLKK